MPGDQTSRTAPDPEPPDPCGMDPEQGREHRRADVARHLVAQGVAKGRRLDLRSIAISHREERRSRLGRLAEGLAGTVTVVVDDRPGPRIPWDDDGIG